MTRLRLLFLLVLMGALLLTACGSGSEKADFHYETAYTSTDGKPAVLCTPHTVNDAFFDKIGAMLSGAKTGACP